ncbi:glycosyltransferase family 4 protein [Methanohalophilus portucalensis]|uniref:Glycosyltransferase n=2 Tax=Methanohalophilus portucalensis TaxID=39664 RepID=A0A1L9C508_9EURY|nr:glycosyltransferase family 4 protein [Methanohalophilus portucalensis]ATU08255.1 hypothetical protein BKM01_05420 [Methanohalophilus portucalensis]OJH49571.1 group 1 glycosyl transferase [Methanohalophilus portucalensis FDF-1]RNI13577.1 glycosyltransferase [Methanohalophilus portucalensis FDF-1]SMH35365.1 Glycosyltransferase involved in cell wall bisynthesis [Methanohalophilus portucalensis FDF-1]
MKIAYLANSIIPSRTANSIHVMKMCQAFAKNGHDVVLLVPNRYSEEESVDNVYSFYGVDDCFEIKKMPFKKIKYAGMVYKSLHILNVLGSIKPDFVYSRDLPSCTFVAMKNYDTFLELHQPLISKVNSMFFKLLIKQKNFKKLIVISNPLKDIFSNNYSLADNYIRILPDGADEVYDFSPIIDWPGKNDNLQVGYVGHLYKGKGIEVIENICHMSSDVDFHIIGGLDEDIKYWKNRINSNNVTFHGFVPQSKLSYYINSLDVCLLPNQKTILPHGAKSNKSNISDFTSPLKMFDYMAHKKAIVASDLPVLKEVLNHNNAVLVDPEKPDEWIDAIEKLKDKHLRERIGKYAYDDLRKNYTWSMRAQQILKIYNGHYSQ